MIASTTASSRSAPSWLVAMSPSKGRDARLSGRAGAWMIILADQPQGVVHLLTTLHKCNRNGGPI